MTTTSRQSLLATFEDRAQADQFAAWIEQHRQPNRSVSGDLDLGPELANLLLRALRTVADGGSVVLSSFRNSCRPRWPPTSLACPGAPSCGWFAMASCRT